MISASKQLENFLKVIFSDDLDFYEMFIISLSDEEQEEFFKNNPEFMSGYPFCHENLDLLKEKTFRNILWKIKMYEENKNSFGK